MNGIQMTLIKQNSAVHVWLRNHDTSRNYAGEI